MAATSDPRLHLHLCLHMRLHSLHAAQRESASFYATQGESCAATGGEPIETNEECGQAATELGHHATVPRQQVENPSSLTGQTDTAGCYFNNYGTFWEPGEPNLWWNPLPDAVAGGCRDFW